MKILVTGGAGFIGSHIVDKCIDKGWQVVVIDNLSSGKKNNINLKAKFYQVDITNYSKLKSIFENEKPHIVNHHAAQINVRKSVQNPQYDAKINIIGSLNLLDLSVKYNVEKFIFASSGGTIYGECYEKPPKENFYYNPLSPYGCSKLAVEYYMNFYHKIYNLKSVSLRYSNVYGPRQDSDTESGVVSIFIRRMMDNKDVYIFGNGEQMRDFVYIEDVVSANIKCILKKDINFEIYNVATQKPTSIKELFYILSDLLGYKKQPVFKPKREGEIFKSYLDITKIKKELNWQPKISLKEGLKKVIDYFI